MGRYKRVQLPGSADSSPCAQLLNGRILSYRVTSAPFTRLATTMPRFTRTSEDHRIFAARHYAISNYFENMGGYERLEIERYIQQG